MKKTLQLIALKVYELLVRTGLMKWRPVRHLFVTLYSAYKTLIESGPVERLHDQVSPGSIVIDIGANVGFFTRKFARWVGVAGYVIAVEPDAENFAHLTRLLNKSNEGSRVKAYNAAAAAKDGILHLQRNEVHPGDHRLARDGKGIEIPAFAIDSLVPEPDVSRRVALIKIDVQGAEMQVLQGAWHTIDTSRPALFIELDDAALRDFDSSAAEIVDALSQRNYVPHQLSVKGPPRRLSREEILDNVAKNYIDVLFLPA
ncbi:MAG: FkbM family methyltransferase [Parvibaculum sp.]|uniref:FkbM family methyltransferase n=1 Tax=Parvibaculum sp. TaxID=2024848 RepID=UPI003C71EAA3